MRKKFYTNIFKTIMVIILLFTIKDVDIRVNAKNNSNYNFTNITTNDGLSQGSVEDIFQDSNGILWFATNDGLNRYDGYEFKVLKGDLGDKNTLWPGLVNSIMEDKDGYLWVGTSGGLSKIDRKNLSVERIGVDKDDANKISDHNIHSIFLDSKKNIWVGTEDGLNAYDYNTKTFEKYLYDKKNIEQFNSVGIMSIAENADNEIIVGTKSGVRIVDKNFKGFKNINSDDKSTINNATINTIYKDKNNDLWIGTLNDGILKLNYETKAVEIIKFDNETENVVAKSMVEDFNGNIWIGTTQGLIKYSEDSIVKYLNRANDVKSLVNDFVLKVYKDKTGLIWIGTYNGISRINTDQKFINYQKIPGELNSLSGESVSGIYEDAQGNLWIGTSNDGLNMLNRKTDTFIHYKNDPNDENTIASDRIRQVTGDLDGNIWIGTSEGLTKIDAKTKKLKTYKYTQGKNSLANNDVRELFVDDNGLIWIGTRHGLDIFDTKTEEFINLNHIFTNNGIEELFVRKIFKDKDDNYWLAVGWKSGLVKIDVKNKKFIKYRYKEGDKSSLSDDIVMSINQGFDGAIWIGTSNGLNCLDQATGEIKIYKEKDGLANSYIYGILLDEQGNLWMSTNGGISKFNVVSKSFENYAYSDGLQGNEFNVISYFKSITGEMFFGGVNGVSSFRPSQLEAKNKMMFPVRISGLFVYNNPDIMYDDVIDLKSEENNFIIDFFVPDFREPDNIKYEYMLEGFDTIWINSDNKRSARYTNIPPGEYVFNVRARLKNGQLSDVNSFNINISKPWYISNIAIVIYIIIVILIILIAINYLKILDGLIRQKTIQLHSEILTKDQLMKDKERLYEEKEKLYEEVIRYEKFRNTYLVNLSHELRTPLNVILSSEQLISSLNKSKNGVEKDNLNKYMKIIKRNSINLLEVINDLIDSSRIKSGAYNIKYSKADIVYLVEEIALSLKSYVEHNGIDLIIDPDIEEKIIDCDKVEIERCIINLISNAVKFSKSEGGTIFINIKEFESEVWIIVRDTGIGISEEHQNIIFDRFTQIETGISSKHFSSGIGLTLVKDIVDLHKGSISLKSELGVGSEFVIKLPIDKK